MNYYDYRTLQLHQFRIDSKQNPNKRILYFIRMKLRLFGVSVLYFVPNNIKRISSIIAIIVFFVFSTSFCSRLFGGTAVSNAASFEYLTYDSNIELAKNDQLSEGMPGTSAAESGIDEYNVELDMDNDPSSMYTMDTILADREAHLPDYAGNTAQDTGNRHGQYNFDSSDWRIMLVNKQHPIPEGYTFTLGNIGGGMQCDARILEPLFDMLEAGRADGVKLVVCSPYRNMDKQVSIFTNKINANMNKGMSYREAYTASARTVTVPGSSEHQLGLALDIVCDTYSILDEGFANTAAGKWLAEHSREYGFILRYPKDKEYITSIAFEPWHFRYVGVEAATIIMDEGITLEEFWDKYM